MGKHKVKRQPPVQRACKQCGARFLVYQNQIASGGGHFCSKTCRVQASKRPKPIYTCQCCGKVFALGSKKKERKYCSRGCFQKVRAQTPAKTRGGGRPHKHDKWRLAVILRDKKCVRCGAPENLQAHHLKP